MLESASLVSLSTVEPDLTYAFRHPLMQEIAYRSLTRHDRKILHKNIGDVLEQTYPDRLNELAPVLGNHFDKAGDRKKAVGYYCAAGHAAQHKYANPEAVMYFQRALKLAVERKESQPPNDGILLDLCTNLGRVLELSGQHLEALRHYQEMEDLARRLEDPSLELAALIARITLLSTPTFVYDPEKSRDLAQQALEIAHRLDDKIAEAKIYWLLLLANSFSANVDLARKYGEQSLELARSLNLPEQTAYTLNDLGSYVYAYGGEFDRAIQTLEEARTIWREIEDFPMLADNLTQIATIYLFQGKVREALELIDEGYQISKSIKNMWGQADSLSTYSLIYTFIGLGDRALAALDESIRVGESSGFAGSLAISYTLKGYLYANLGAFEEGVRQFQEAIQVGGDISNFWVDQAYGCLAFLYAFQGKVAEAEDALRLGKSFSSRPEEHQMMNFMTAAECELRLARGDYQGLFDYASSFLETIQRLGANAYRPDCLYYMGVANRGLSHISQARSMLEEAEREARSLKVYRMLWRILAAQVELDLEQGNRETALARLQQARQEVAYVAEHAGNELLRSAFLSLETVRRLEKVEI